MVEDAEDMKYFYSISNDLLKRKNKRELPSFESQEFRNWITNFKTTFYQNLFQIKRSIIYFYINSEHRYIIPHVKVILNTKRRIECAPKISYSGFGFYYNSKNAQEDI